MKKEYIVELREEEADELMEEHWVGELVRCKDCKYYPDGDGSTTWLPCREIITPPGWFCADGERREAND